MTLNDIIITNELGRRPPHRFLTAQAENKLLHGLARSLGKPSARLLRSFVEDALKLTGAGSAGVSLLENDDSGGNLFRWVALAGAYKSFVGGSTPRDFSPCGACLDRNSAQLYSYPARYFDYFAKVQPPIVEGLVLPIWASGEALGTIWVVSHDLTRRFNSEDVRVLSSIAGFLGCILAFRKTSAQHLALSACSPMGIFETDPFGRVTYVNKRFQMISGLNPQRIVGQNWSSALSARDRRKLFSDWRRKTKKGIEYSEEMAFQRPSGQIRWVYLRSAPLRYNGVVNGYVSSVEDITERRERDRSLRENEAFKAGILSSSPDCIKVLDSTGRLIFMNSLGREKMEIDDLNSVLGRKWTSFWNGKGRSQAIEALETARRGGEGKFRGEAPTIKGTLKWWDVIVTGLQNHCGQSERFLAISRDITAYKVTELALDKAKQELERHAGNLEAHVGQRTAQLEAANTQLRALAAQLINAQEEERRKLAHLLHDEIGQELTGLKLLLDHSGTRNQENSEANEVLAELITRVSHLAQDLRPAVLERLGLLAALRWQTVRIAKQFEIKVVLHCDGLSEDDFTPALKVEVFRIIQEALTNAARHSGARTARLSLKQRENRLEISIQDSGKGFDLKRAGKKASLGLLGIRERVARLGGEIKIVTGPNRGTNVELYIPLLRSTGPLQ